VYAIIIIIYFIVYFASLVSRSFAAQSGLAS
jgi:hypothetical protein